MLKQICLAILLPVVSLTAGAQDAVSENVTAGAVGVEGIRFRVNESMIDTSYSDNGSRLRRLETMLAGSRIDSVVILSTASPDGRKPANEALALRRAGTVASWLETLLGGGKNI